MTTTILHNPFGQEHPYEQLPEERFPRYPLADEPFAIGIVTRPPGTVQSITVHSEIDGVPQAPIEAANLVGWRPELEDGVGAEFLERMVKIDQDVWKAWLTAPAAGQTLVYWAEADGVSSERFTLRGESWQTGGGYMLDGQTMTLAHNIGARHVVPLPPRVPQIRAVEWLTDGEKARQVRVTFAAQPDERFFGFGERFNAPDQRGNVVDIRVYEQYKNQGQRTYMPIPFMLSSAGCGVHVNSSRWMQFDLTAPDTWTLTADVGDEALTLNWYSDSDPIAIVAQFAQATGPVVLPPQWAFGLWMSSNEWNSQARIIREVETSLEHGIQPSVIVIEAWSDENTFYIWNDAQYTPKSGGEAFKYGDFNFPADGKWTDPKAMVDWLHERGVKILLWQIPVMKVPEGQHPQQDADRAYYETQRFGVRDADGSAHKIRPFWFRGGTIWDVTNPAEREWWFSKRAYLLDEIGIDGFKTDGGEHLWGTDVKFADGRGGDEVWNEYPRLYSEAYYNFANSKREAVTFSRAGFTGSQRSPLHWAGDENSTWDAYRHSILAGLSAAVSGISFWGWDFGGFSGEIPDAELYLRAAAMAVFCPVFQYHAEYNAHREPNRDRTPWNIAARTGDERVLPIFKQLMDVREKLMPYIWREAQHSAATGEPMMRALKLYDANADDYQYFFGRDLLVCPVVEAGVARSNIYLPAGQWQDYWTGEVIAGGRSIEIDAPLNRIPVFERA